jgi:hypothetical protein
VSNFNIILELATKLKINHRLLSAMGSVEKQTYEDIQSGAYIPAEVDDRNATRIFVIGTHIKNLLTEYNQVRFFHRLIKPPQDLLALIDSSGVPKHKIAELAKKLPDVYDGYNEKFTYIQRVKKPREIVEFCIQSFCQICHKIYDNPDKETEKLRHEFCNYIVRKILRSEELLTKPGHFNWSLLYGDKQSETTFEAREDDDDEARDSDAEDDDVGDTDAPLADNFDMEDADEDGETNSVRVGEDLGLS